MKMNTLPSISIIGSGKVATSLGHFFISKGFQIQGLHSRNIETGKACAKAFNCDFIKDIQLLQADIIFVAISDDQIKSIIKQIKHEQAIVYTAGSVNLHEIEHPNTGVFYPLQTFIGLKSDAQFDFPVLIESKTDELSLLLQELCELSGIQFDLCDSRKRADYHLVAVFLNNFINHLGKIAKTENDQRNLNWDILKPLLDKTVFNILNNSDLDNQTGPAIREDYEVIKKHHKMLNEQHRSVYEAITQSIIKTKKEK